MKTSITPTTRENLITTAQNHGRWMTGLVMGGSVLSLQPLLAVDNLWTGAINNQYEVAGNWSLGRVPVSPNGNAAPNDFDDAIINTMTNFPIVTVNSVTPRDLRVGSAGGTTGRLDVRSGTATSGNGNWGFVGVSGGTGTLNVANTAVTGSGLTGFAQGSGSLLIGSNSGGGRLYVGGDDSGNDAGNGTLNVHTTGTITIRNDLSVGSQGGTGVFNLESGTVTSGSAASNAWSFVGSSGATGTMNMSGGSFSVWGRFYCGDGGNGNVNVSGGSLTKNTNEPFVVANGTSTSVLTQTGGTIQTSGGELWVGQGANANGTYNMSGGSLSVGNWVAIGRDGGTGKFNHSGGTFTKTGGGNFIVGASGPGMMTISGGLVEVQNGVGWVGETNNATGTLTISSSGEFRVSTLQLAVNGGTTGNLNLNGGTLRTSRIFGGGGTENVSFDGTQIIATGNQAAFIDALQTATVGSGGLRVDSNGFTLISSQLLGGAGGVTKSGEGTLSLLGANTFGGASEVLGGKLVLSNQFSGTGSISVADGASLGVVNRASGAKISPQNLTFGSSGATSLDLDNGNSSNPTVAMIDVTGQLTMNGDVTVNLAASLPQVGIFPVLKYAAKTGSGSFVLGAVPLGVVADLVDDGAGNVDLVISSVALPRWEGDVSDVWDQTTANWVDQVTSNPTLYIDGNPVMFNDDAFGSGAVVLNEVVVPGGVTFQANLITYSITGAGSISGTGGLVKKGTGTATVETSNDFTGVTRVEQGVLNVNSIGDGGMPSAVGAATSASSNLVLAGGRLNYTGPAASTNRGFTVSAAGSGLSLQADLTVTGRVSNVDGQLAVTGPGVLTVTNDLANAWGSVGNPALRADSAGFILNGAGGQTHAVTGELWVGSSSDRGTNFQLNQSTLNVSSWIAIGRGNGAVGLVTDFSATGSTITSGNCSTGFDAAVPGHQATSSVTLHDTNWTNGGDTNFAESNGSTSTITLSGTSVFTSANRILTGMAANATGHLILRDQASIQKPGGWFSVGVNGTGTMTLEDQAVYQGIGDFNVADLANSKGTLTIGDSAQLTGGQVYVGKGAGSIGLVNQSGGVFTGGLNGDFQIAANGTGTWNLSAGTVNANGWAVMARYEAGVGALNVSGGSFHQVGVDRGMIVGELGQGQLNVTGTGEVPVEGNVGVVIGNGGTAVGVVNLDGGRLTTKRVQELGGTSSFHFHGGLLKAAVGANANFMAGLDLADVKSGGALIDTNGQNVAIAQALLDGGGGGGLIKSGGGFLQLNGINTYTGETLVQEGSLGGSGSVAGPLTVSSGARLAPGASAGTFRAGETTIQGHYDYEIDGVDADRLVVDGALDVSAATLNISTLAGGATQPVYIVASYTGPVPLPFAQINGMPAGYSIDYSYNGGTQIALIGSLTPYQSWIASYFPGETDPEIVDAGADPDGDGSVNSLEFALGGEPNQRGSRPKVFHLIEDTDDVGTARELVLTIAVRSATGTFVGSPPSASGDGYTYKVQGSSNLNGFTAGVTPLSSAVVTGLEPAPSGYVYRSFRLEGSDGLAGQGFLRVEVTP